MQGTELQWIGKRGGYEGAVCLCHLLCRIAEMELADCLGTVDAVAHFYRIEIDFHDAALPPNNFYESGKIDFESLSQPGRFRPEENVLGRLLTDGRGSALSSSFLVFLPRLTDGL